MNGTRTGCILTALAGAAIAAPAPAEVDVFFDIDQWKIAAGETKTITFTEFPYGTLITDQYADLGVLFSDGNDTIHVSSGYVNDGFGLNGHGNITVSYTTPQYAIAVDFPGALALELRRHGELVYRSLDYGTGPLFVGLVSTDPFDEAMLLDPSMGYQFIDDLHVDPRPVGDMDNDGLVNVADLLSLLSQWGECPPPPAECPGDLNGDDRVGAGDLLILLGNWG
ncbi:MAG: hypothetical protein SYC29_15175 [Planctomycetota bacterium]|nr:hypothetical protein [Planctomycetota bacterium]